MRQLTRIGILTSGGDAPGMNAIVAGACEQVARVGGHAYGIRGGFAGLAEHRAARITPDEARARLRESGTWLGTSRWPALRTQDGRNACDRALDALGLNALLVIGGNGSAIAARALATGVRVAFVPATIDCDIEETDITIGLDSAVNLAVETIDRLRITARSLPGRAFLVETLGAPNGFLADAVAEAASIEHVLVPERPINLDAVAAELHDLAPSGSAIAIMSEAVGDAVRISEDLSTRAGIRVHPTILGHAQRAATPSAQDRAMGQAAGRAAVDAVSMSRSCFVTLGRDRTANAVPLIAASDESATRSRPVPTNLSSARGRVAG